MIRTPSLLGIVLVVRLAAGTPALAEETPLVEPADWSLLPLDELERPKLERDHSALVTSLRAQAKELDEATRRLESRENPDDEESARLRKSIANTRAKMEPALRECMTVLAEYGVDADVASRIRAAPKAFANRVARYAHGLVLAVELADLERGLLAPLVAAVDGAELGLVARRQRAERSLGRDQPAQDPNAQAAARQAAGDLDNHRREIERRFWLVVDCVLDIPRKAEIRRFLPGEFARHADAFGHAQRLPSLEPSQAARLQAFAAELESESAADQAEERRLATKLREATDLSAEERASLARELAQARNRLLDLRWGVARSAKAVLTPEQVTQFEAIPPFVGPGDRNLRRETMLAGIALTDEQKRRVAGLVREYEGRRREIEQEMREARMVADGASAEAPQQQMARMKTLALEGATQAEMRDAARRVYLEILTPEQVADWVLGIDENEKKK